MNLNLNAFNFEDRKDQDLNLVCYIASIIMDYNI